MQNSWQKIRPFLLLSSCLLVLMNTGVSAWANEGADEQLLLAAFTFNVTKFVSWNQRSSMKQANTPIRIGVFQNQNLLENLKKISNGKMIDGHNVEVFKLDPNHLSPNEMPEVTVLIPATGSLQSGIPKKLSGCKCLLITNGEAADQVGSIINFYSEDAHLRFTIDMERAKAEGLDLSSQLLKLGKIL